MSKVTEVKASDWKTTEGEARTTYYVTLDDRPENVPAYDARAKDLAIGAELPPGWEVTKSKAGKDYLKPPGKSGGGGGGYAQAYRNGKEAFDREQTSIHRSVALEWAVRSMVSGGSKFVVQGAILPVADEYYAWLQATGSGSAEAGIGGGTPVPSPSTSGGMVPGESPGQPSSLAHESPPDPHSPEANGLDDGEAGGVGAVGTGSGEPTPTLLAQLSEAYGSGPKALLAARAYYSDAPPASLSELSEAQIGELVEMVAP